MDKNKLDKSRKNEVYYRVNRMSNAYYEHAIELIRVSIPGCKSKSEAIRELIDEKIHELNL